MRRRVGRPVAAEIGSSFADSAHRAPTTPRPMVDGDGRDASTSTRGWAPVRRSVDSFQQGDAATGTPSAWGVYGQFGLFFLPGPKVPSVSANRLVSEEVGRFWLRSCDPCTVSDR